jgi:hypothetical protein
MLELHPASGGWLPPPGNNPKGISPRRLPFPSLAAAIRYAEWHGIDYRVVIRSPHPAAKTNRRGPKALPGSWVASLRRNGRNGDNYHG